MKKFIIVTVTVIVISAFYLAMKEPIKYEAISDISEKEFECATDFAYVTLDNPIERKILYKVKISKVKNGQLLAKAYYPVGIPYTEILVSKDCDDARRQR